MAMEVRQLGILVGIDKLPSGEKAYRVIIASIKAVGNKKYDWAFECRMMSENQIISTIKSSKWLNVMIDSAGKLKGSAGSLDRFNHGKPYVIISQITDGARIIGYKVASYDGKVKNIQLKQMLAYGTRITSGKDGVPVQNAIFVPADGDKKEYYKAYPGCSFIEEVIDRSKNEHTQVNRVNTQKNAKTLSKLEDIFTPSQIKQLKEGKRNGVDIRVYANPALSAEQMQELRKGLECGLNVRPLAFPEFKPDLIKYYVADLKAGQNINQYLNPKYSVGQVAELSLAYELGLDISKMSNPKLTPNEMADIRERLELNIFKDELVKKDGSWS